MKRALLFRAADSFGTDDPPELAAENLRAAVTMYGAALTGSEREEGFALTCKSRIPNPFRPELTVTLHDEEDGGTEVVTQMRLHPVILGFLVLWSVIVACLAVWRGWLLLFMLVIFWGIALAGFSLGCRDARQELRALLYRRTAVLVETQEAPEDASEPSSR
ncbi:MAG: hypothetical protein IJ055_03605 [Oscillospiraceae bacterium]|nr:hypothetical protein [Oscillospiraceae bacterium]